MNNDKQVLFRCEDCGMVNIIGIPPTAKDRYLIIPCLQVRCNCYYIFDLKLQRSRKASIEEMKEISKTQPIAKIPV